MSDEQLKQTVRQINLGLAECETALAKAAAATAALEVAVAGLRAALKDAERLGYQNRGAMPPVRRRSGWMGGPTGGGK